MHLIAGLGNPGQAYRATRHNVGFMVVDRMAASVDGEFSSHPTRCQVCLWRSGPLEALLVKPQTYMNLSGHALAGILRAFPTEFSRVLVVYDEIALPLGRLRLRPKGSSGGQKGMRSVIEALGSEEIPRLRVGISRGELPDDISDYVLSEFASEDREELDGVLDRAAQACRVWMSQGIERAMSQFN